MKFLIQLQLTGPDEGPYAAYLLGRIAGDINIALDEGRKSGTVYMLNTVFGRHMTGEWKVEP
jgi:hypothetical protein